MAPKNPLWTITKESELITLVHREELVWNIQHRQYSRNDLKNACFDTIAQKLGAEYTGSIVRDRWRNMCNTFHSNDRKVKKSSVSGSGTDDVYVPVWEHFKSLQFLRKNSERTKSVSNMAQPFSAQPAISKPGPSKDVLPDVQFDENLKAWMSADTASPNASATSAEDIDDDLSEFLVLRGPQHEPSTGSRDETMTSATPPLSSPDENKNSIYMKRGKKRAASTLLEEAVSALKDLASQEIPTGTSKPQDALTQDPCAAYVASKLKDMTPPQRMKCEAEIMNVIFNNSNFN